ncbi:LADA_0C10440g1_1 [Lachancea dasiensis]|uniref:Nucleotide exchange factor SIL1 n=1 Tax=Lachancea dasiensis TaxID=1072105 RepID=A0A1G4J101_9SACH|nr:LADA_0C10440g1_1 [Lachancea dasiensis]
MRWVLFLFTGALANELITLSPSSAPATVANQNSGSGEQEETDLFIGDALICNKEECYPKIFEPKTFWQEVRPAQHIPAGLDIRMDFDTGIREAKIGSPQNAETSSSVNIMGPQSESSLDIQASYEFSKDFEKIRHSIRSLDYTQVDQILDELLEFSHDYKHGFKIVSHEFSLLKSLIFDQEVPLTTRQIASTMLTGCLRNNPPATLHIYEADPQFTQQIFQELAKLTNNPPSPQLNVLVKRYLSILQAMLDKTLDLDEAVLLKLCQWGDDQVKRRALEVVSRSFQDHESGSLQKRTESIHNVQTWVDEFSSGLQDENVDELHIRNFFNSLYNIKRDFGKNVKVDSHFLNWLSTEADLRQARLHNGLKERDLEQDEFDQRLIDSRHLVFGNPMAHRIKRFHDEL